MAYDETLAERVRDELSELTGVVEKKMFGGLTFMVGGNMTVGIYGDGLLARVGDAASALAEPGVRQFEMMPGRPARDFVVIGPEVLDDEALSRWIRRARDYAATLPPKKKR